MRKPEQRLWDSFRSNLPPWLYLERLENIVAPGTPDVVALATRGVMVTSFVELKATECWPARDDTPVLGNGKGLNADQVNWHINWTRRGGDSWILIGVGVKAERQLFLFSGLIAREINQMSKRALLAARPETWQSIALRLSESA
jgi:hypothetical protein